MKTYVVGLAFDEQDTETVLIRKQTGPTAVIGWLNGVGGKVESCEMPHDAMAREFREETGVRTDSRAWRHLTTLFTDEYQVHFFHIRSDDVLDAKTTTHEEVSVLPLSEVPWDDVIPNLRWMIPLCLDPHLVNPHLGRLRMVR